MNCLGATAARKGVRHGRRKPARSVPGRGGKGRKKDTLICNSAKKLQWVHFASRFLAAGWTCSCSMDKGGCEEVHFCTFFSKNAKGKYLPIGYRLNTYNEFSCCYFTGKEKDSETGYGYFGARYMDHELMTMWLSVDPLADKYPNISPYAYCAWNPVKLVDPDGREAFDEYGWWKNKITNKMEWAPDIHSQKELNDKYGKGAGTYKGLTHEENGTYYSLFGTKEKSNSKQGMFTKKMDEVCINHALWLDRTAHDPTYCGDETPVDFSGIEKMSKGKYLPTTRENVRDGYSYFGGRAKARVYATGNPKGTWNYSWGQILSPSNQDVNSNLGTASLNGYHLRIGNVALLRFGSQNDANAFKETFYKIFPNAK